LEAEPRPSRASAFAWFTEASASARSTLLAASLGWMLDSYDVMLYSLVLPALMEDLGFTKSNAGVLGSVTLLAAAAGGLIFGIVADRRGRTVALRWSIMIYAVFTAACGAAQSLAALLVFRILLGLGMGGEWASGAALFPRHGLLAIGAKRLDSCKAPGPSDTHSLHSRQQSSCR